MVLSYGSSSKPMQNASNRCFGKKSGCTSGSGDDTGLRQKDTDLWDRLTMGKYRNMEALEILRGKNEQGFSHQSYVVCVFVCVHSCFVCV